MSQKNRFDIRRAINSDTVIGFTSAKEMKTQGWMDSNKVSSYLLDEEDTYRKHLGMINLFATTHQVAVPFMRDLFKDAAVLEVSEGEEITYDLPVNRMEIKCVTAQDTSEYQQYPGIDGAYFQLVLTEEFTANDILTFDMQYGDQVIVSEDHEVERVGENFLHYVRMVTNDKMEYYPKDKLKSGIQYFKIGHKTGEYSTSFSGINMIKNPTGSIKCQFILGNPRAVETFMTRSAANMKSDGLNAFTDSMMDRVQNQLDALGGKDREMFFIGKAKGGDIDTSTMKIGTTLEYLALMELAQMECYELLFAKGATINDNNGVKRINEGVWHQIRRGKLIKYPKPGGITIDHIHEAVAYVYKNDTSIPVSERRVKFKAGHFAYQNLLQIFREEAVSQLGSLPAGMLGTDAQIDKVFEGELNNLTMKEVAIKTVTIPGVGVVEVEHDPSLDYQPFADRFSSGMFGQGFAHTSYSMVMWDVTKPEYSNVTKKVKNASLVEGGSQTSNIYYIKPEGNHVVYGYEQGRMANGSQTEDVMSSMKYMGKTFWAFSQSGALVLDTTRYVVIELDRNN